MKTSTSKDEKYQCQKDNSNYVSGKVLEIQV